ncbi:MAG: GNAT family N-acetyltransferase [Deltaproteobacteria bacterium]|nr:GNAT family N-acetyltransferase [Kofleriaceae bacterium]
MIDIRDAEPGDYDAYARLLPELGTGDPVPSRERFADLCDRMLVATGDGAVVGYALFELLADVGYVRNLVSDRARRREGIGAALLEAMRARFVAAGARTWCLNVRPGNHAAIALYRRFGFTAAYGSYMLRVPRHAAVAPVAGLVYDPITPEEEPAVEAAAGLLRGQLASARAKPGRMLLQLHHRGALAGVAVFDPAFPGAFPFRVFDASLGPAAVAALRAFAPAGSPHVQVGVEDHDALRDALLAAGAEIHLDIVHMRGATGTPPPARSR